MNKLEEYISKYSQIHADNSRAVLLDSPVKERNDVYGDGTEFVNKIVPHIAQTAKSKNRAISILDYGCGQALHVHDPSYTIAQAQRKLKHKSLFAHLEGRIQCYYCYDPAIPLYSIKPTQGTLFDFVAVCDVMEHVPEEYVDYVMQDAVSFLKEDGVIAFTVSGMKSWSYFKNDDGTIGENLHCTIHSFEWWQEKIQGIVGDKAWLLKYTNNDFYKKTEGKFNCFTTGKSSSKFNLDLSAHYK